MRSIYDSNQVLIFCSACWYKCKSWLVVSWNMHGRVDAIPTHLMFSNHDCAHLHSLVLYKLQRLHTIHTAHCVHLKWLKLNSTLLHYVQLDSKLCEQIGRIQNTLQQSPFPPSLMRTHSHHKQIVCLWCKWVNTRFGWKSDYCYVFWILNQSVHRINL